MTEKVAPKPFALRSALDVIKATPAKPPCLVDDLLLSVGVSMITAKPKTGKSSLVRQLSVAVADGYEFLGHGTTQGSVLYLSLEGPLGVIGDHLRRLQYTERKGTIHIVDERMPTNINSVLEKMELTLASLPDCRLVIIDPALKFLRLADSNKTDDVGPAVELLEVIAKKFALHIMMVLHSGKRVNEDPGDNALGSTGFRGGTDTNIFLVKQGTDRIMSTEQRWGTALEPTVLLFNAETGENRLGSSLDDIENAKRLSKERKTRDRVQTDLLAAVAELKSATQAQLLAKVTGKGTTLLEALASLVENGMLEKSGTGSKGNPCVYRLRTEKD